MFSVRICDSSLDCGVESDLLGVPFKSKLAVMNLSSKLKVSAERHFSAHHMLIGAAQAALDDAKSKRPGWFYSELTAITLSALALEAICNSVGERVIEGWKDFESSSPAAKIRLLCQHLGIPYERTTEPWSSAIWLGTFRNQIAHAKPELVQESRVITRTEYDNRPRREPLSKLEKHVTTGNARRALRTAETIKDMFCLKVPPDNAFGLYSDSWSHSASAHNDGY